MSKPDYVLSTYIKCTPEALWNALRDPAQMVNYDFLGQTATLEGEVTVLRAPDGTVTLHTRELEVEPDDCTKALYHDILARRLDMRPAVDADSGVER